MPSVMDIQQQSTLSSNVSGKATPPPPTTTAAAASTDPSNADPLTQAILALDKKQRNLGKRKEKLESYQEEAKKGKELHKDQKEALQKYPEVLGQIEILKEFNEQLKKIQVETAKNQKRLSKQAAEEKRSLLSQSLRQYAQVRYLIEHRPTSLQADQSTLLDQLSSSVLPADDSNESISRSVDTVLAIYQHAPATIVKNLTGKTPQEVRETLENIFKSLQPQQQTQLLEKEEEEVLPTSSLLPSEPQQESLETVEEQQPEQQQQAPEQVNVLEQNNNLQSSSNRLFTDYPLQFDTRNQNIPLDQLMQDTTFFSIDSNNQLEDESQDQNTDPNQFIQTITVVNSNINDQPLGTSLENTKQEEQQGDEQWQQRGNSANRGGQFNGNANRNYNRRGAYYHQTQRGGPRGGGGAGRYENSYGGNQRPYNDQNRGRGGYRGNRGGGYRGYNNNNNNGNGYPKSAQYQQNYAAGASQQTAQ